MNIWSTGTAAIRPSERICPLVARNLESSFRLLKEWSMPNGARIFSANRSSQGLPVIASAAAPKKTNPVLL